MLLYFLAHLSQVKIYLNFATYSEGSDVSVQMGGFSRAVALCTNIAVTLINALAKMNVHLPSIAVHFCFMNVNKYAISARLS